MTFKFSGNVNLIIWKCHAKFDGHVSAGVDAIPRVLILMGHPVWFPNCKHANAQYEWVTQTFYRARLSLQQKRVLTSVVMRFLSSLKGWLFWLDILYCLLYKAWVTHHYNQKKSKEEMEILLQILVSWKYIGYHFCTKTIILAPSIWNFTKQPTHE